MKLSELRKCDSCGGVLAPQGNFYLVRLSLAIVDQSAVQQTLGLAMMFANDKRALGIAEALSPRPEAVTVAGDESPELMTELLVCPECYMLKPLRLAEMAEKMADRVLDDGAGDGAE